MGMFIRFSPLWALFGYLIGMYYSSHIFADFTSTHWYNIWVYFWLFAWPVGILYHFFLPMFLVLLVLVVIIGLFVANNHRIGPAISNLRLSRFMRGRRR